MDRYRLSDKEQEVYAKVETLFLTLSQASQYNVLKKIAHNMDREVVRHGQVRVAAAAARGAAVAQSGSKRNSDNIEGKSKTDPKKAEADPIYVKWAATEDGKRVIANHEALKNKLKAMPKPKEGDEKAQQEFTELKNAVSGASALKRQEYQSFRTKHVGPPKTEEAKGDDSTLSGPPKPDGS